MTVTTAKGFLASGIAAGIKVSGNADLALIQNIGPIRNSAVVFTSNRAKANPILWSMEVAKGGVTEAIVLNSGGANCFTGEIGFQITHATAEAVAEALDVSAAKVLVCSTGLIGDQLPKEKLLAGVKSAAGLLTDSGGPDAARAIMTTDTVPKTAEFHANGWSIGGMAKGAGMLAPGLATMLVVITTDANLSSAELDDALKFAVKRSFNRLDSDGCMSTNDQVTLMASGASGITPSAAEFGDALAALCLDLAMQLMNDAEGASHNIAISVSGAASEDDAEEVARSVARNNLFKAAVFGNDPNWGRILAAIGTTQAAFDPYQVDVTINGVRVCRAGGPDRPRDEVDMTPRDTNIGIELFNGAHSATVWSNDLTHDYVEENSAYSS
ncbi:MAG: bifunctional glutamate N-acetyltransferase/amino-acid acetyltransferase ArgJ [Microbacteriaceae bacterium]